MKNHIDYGLKAKILTENSKLLKLENKSRFKQFLIDNLTARGFDPQFCEEIIALNSEGVFDYPELEIECLLDNKLDLLKECKKINYANFKRVRKLKERINDICLNYEQPYFITLTFTDSAFKTTNEKTRRTYVARFLKSTNCPYVANVDYGQKNEREHYHAVIGLSKKTKLDFSKRHYLCGAVDSEKIRVNDKSVIRLSKYVSKLTNHAIKETNKRCAIIYSREKKTRSK